MSLRILPKIISVIFVAFFVTGQSAFAGGGGISGGGTSNARPQFEEVRICNFGEAGESCMNLRLPVVDEMQPGLPNGNGLECRSLNSNGAFEPCRQDILFKTPRIFEILNKMIRSQQEQGEAGFDPGQSGG